MRAVIQILVASLSRFDGLILNNPLEDVLIEHAELTNHFGLLEHPQGEAIKRMDQLFSTRFPTRCYNRHGIDGEPTITGIGKQKRSRVCRVYDPRVKFDKRPEHVPVDAWEALTRTVVGDQVVL